MGLNREIGVDNQLPWHLPKDLKHFKEITSGHSIIVISRKKDWFEEGILIVGSIKEAIKFGQKIDEDIFIIGGGNIFEQTMDIADKLEVTEIKTNIEADTFFPKIDPKIWAKTDEVCHEKDEKNNFDFCFQTFQRGK